MCEELSRSKASEKTRSKSRWRGPSRSRVSRPCLGEREAVLDLGHIPVTEESSMDMGQAIGGLPPSGRAAATTRAPAWSGWVRSILTYGPSYLSCEQAGTTANAAPAFCFLACLSRRRIEPSHPPPHGVVQAPRAQSGKLAL